MVMVISNLLLRKVVFSNLVISFMGPFINDVTALGERGYQGFFDNSTKALLLKSVMMGGGGVKNYRNLRDVIY